MGRSRKSISSLMDIRPDYANLEKNGGIIEADPDEVSIGDIIVIRPGERIPLDGVIIEGSTSVDTSALTGESVPRSLTDGDDVISGCININGVIRVRVTKEFGESTVAKSLTLLKIQAVKSKGGKLYYQICKILYAVRCDLRPAACGSSVSCYRKLVGMDKPRSYFLVISCPCALVISVPLSFSAVSEERQNAVYL